MVLQYPQSVIFEMFIFHSSLTQVKLWNKSRKIHQINDTISSKNSSISFWKNRNLLASLSHQLVFVFFKNFNLELDFCISAKNKIIITIKLVGLLPLINSYAENLYLLAVRFAWNNDKYRGLILTLSNNFSKNNLLKICATIILLNMWKRLYKGNLL